MWAGAGGWPVPPQWPINQAMFQGIPHEQIDWAILAQQWIALKQPDDVSAPKAPPPPPPPPESDCTSKTDQVYGADFGGYWTNSNSGWSQTQPSNLGIPSVMQAPSRMIPPRMQHELFNYGQTPARPGGPPSLWNATTVPFRRMPQNDRFHYHKSAPIYSTPVDQPGFVAPALKEASLGYQRKQKPEVEEVPEPVMMMALDAVKRKQLPVWIRDGLEKMERERQKEQERLMREQQEMDIDDEEGDGGGLVSKFDSPVHRERRDSAINDADENGEESADEDVRQTADQALRTGHARRDSDEFEKIPAGEEERQQWIVMKTRRLLTEILLDVTTSEMQLIAEEVFNREKRKSRPVLTSQVSALASITQTLGAVCNYDISSSESESEDEATENRTGRRGGGASDSESNDSDDELRVAIERKRAEFALAEKELLERVQKEEDDLEEKLAYKAKERARSLSQSHTDEVKMVAVPPLPPVTNQTKQPEPKIAEPKRKPRSRSRSRERGRDSKTTKSADKKRTSRSRSRERKRNRSRTRSRSRDGKKRRSRSRDRKRKRSRTRSKSRSRERRRSRSRSRRRNSRSRSRDRRRVRSDSRERAKKRSNRSASKENRRDRRRSKEKGKKAEKRRSASVEVKKDKKGRDEKKRGRSRSKSRGRKTSVKSISVVVKKDIEKPKKEDSVAKKSKKTDLKRRKSSSTDSGSSSSSSSVSSSSDSEAKNHKNSKSGGRVEKRERTVSGDKTATKGEGLKTAKLQVRDSSADIKRDFLRGDKSGRVARADKNKDVGRTEGSTSNWSASSEEESSSSDWESAASKVRDGQGGRKSGGLVRK